MKKIRYILDWAGPADSGVVAKVESQIRAWERNDISVELIYVCSEKSSAAFSDFKVKYYLHKSGISRIKARWRANLEILKSPKDNLIFRRYGLFLPFEIISILLRRTIIELNTNNDYFYSQRGMIESLWNIAQRKIVGRAANGACAVTNEIAELNKKLFGEIEVVTNGTIIPENFEPRDPGNLVKKIVFLLGDDFKWNGIELLEELAHKLPEFKFEITGNVNYLPKNQNIKVNQFLDRNEISKHLSEFSFGISSLRLDHVGLTEAAPLKNRSYLTHGLPIIGRYPDSAFPHGSDDYFILEFDDEEKLINLPELRQFIDSWDHKRIEYRHLEKVDIYRIEKKRVDFFTRIMKWDCI